MISGLGAVQVLTSSRTYKDDKDKYKIIVKELRSWLEEYFKGMTIDDIPIDDFYKKGMFRMNEYTLDKLNELEGGKND